MKNNQFLWLNRRRALLLGGSAALLPLMTPLSSTFAQPATGQAMKIGVIGSGRVGGTVGGLWAKAGHQVKFSSRHPESLKSIVDGLGPNASAGTVEQAVAFGGVIFIAVPYAALPKIGQENAAGLKGKIVLDACNPISSRDGEMTKEAEEIGVGPASAKYLAGTRLVRAFNSMSWMVFLRETNRPGEKIGIPIASDDAGALAVADKLVRDAGFEPVAVPLVRAKEFAPPGGPLFTKVLPVSELKQQLGIK